MCDPVTIAATAAVIGTAGSVYSQKQQANAQQEANEAQYKNTMTAYRANIEQTNVEQQQEHEATVQKLTQNAMAGRAAMSKAVVGAGESGVSGLSVDSLLLDLGGRQKQYDDSVLTNYDRAQAAINNQRTNVYANAASQINGLTTPQQPDYFGAIARLGSIGLQVNGGTGGKSGGPSSSKSSN